MKTVHAACAPEPNCRQENCSIPRAMRLPSMRSAASRKWRLALTLGHVEHALEQFVHALRIRLPTRGLHHLAHQKTKCIRFAAAILCDSTCVLREDLGDQTSNLPLVVNLRQIFRGHDLLQIGRASCR